MTVNQILSRKGRYFLRNSTITVYAKLSRLMGEKNIGAVLVIEDPSLKGILSERDYVSSLKNKSIQLSRHQEIMDQESDHQTHG
jgi:predicted transcriptional regulator